MRVATTGNVCFFYSKEKPKFFFKKLSLTKTSASQDNKSYRVKELKRGIDSQVYLILPGMYHSLSVNDSFIDKSLQYEPKNLSYWRGI